MCVQSMCEMVMVMAGKGKGNQKTMMRVNVLGNNNNNNDENDDDNNNAMSRSSSPSISSLLSTAFSFLTDLLTDECPSVRQQSLLSIHALTATPSSRILLTDDFLPFVLMFTGGRHSVSVRRRAWEVVGGMAFGRLASVRRVVGEMMRVMAVGRKGMEGKKKMVKRLAVEKAFVRDCAAKMVSGDDGDGDDIHGHSRMMERILPLLLYEKGVREGGRGGCRWRVKDDRDVLLAVIVGCGSGEGNQVVEVAMEMAMREVMRGKGTTAGDMLLSSSADGNQHHNNDNDSNDIHLHLPLCSLHRLSLHSTTPSA